MAYDFIHTYLKAFPFTNEYFADDGKSLFFTKMDGKVRRLFYLNLAESIDLSMASQVSDEDFCSRNLDFLDFDPNSHTLYFKSDTDNKENFNVFALNIYRRELIQLTQATYVNICRFAPDFSFLLFGNRVGYKDGQYLTQLCKLDLKSGETRQIVTDEGWEYRMTWDIPSLSENCQEAIINLDWLNRRNKFNFAKVNLETGEKYHLLPKELESRIHCCDSVYDENGITYVSELTGFNEYYYFDFATQESQRLTNFNERAESFEFQKLKGQRWVAATFPRPQSGETLLRVVNFDKMEKGFEKLLHGARYVNSNKKRFLLKCTGVDEVPHQFELKFVNKKLEVGRRFQFCYGEEKSLVKTRTSFVEYESFDGLKIPAYLSKPEGKLRGAVVISFYGGHNVFNSLKQMYAEIGLATLSPAVRGSWGWGKKWSEMIKGDLGGSEILDVIWGARFLQNKLNLDANQIGVRGGSHGGYAVLRACTMPSDFCGVDSQFPFAFGICEAGFADLVNYYGNSNIPDWLVYMLGPFEENRDLYFDRSPVNHFENLQTPLMIIHGENDNRVPFETMQGFIEKLEQSSVKHRIIVEAGNGHGAGDFEQQFNRYKQVLSFIDSCIP